MSQAENGESFVTVHECWGDIEADAVVSYLAANGVKAVTRGFPRAVYALTVDGLGRIEVKVSTADRKLAEELLADLPEPIPDEDEFQAVDT